MKFARVVALGKERVQVVDNMLSQNKSMYAIARMIQQDWKEFQDVQEKTLVQQLNRYKAYLKLPTVYDTKDKDVKVITATISRVDVINRLGQLERQLRTRLELAIEKEKTMGGILMGQVSAEIKEYRQTLLDIQKVQFDLGIDEYRGPLAQVRAGQQTKTLPDGTVVQTQVIEAVQVAREAMRILNAPQEKEIEHDS